MKKNMHGFWFLILSAVILNSSPVYSKALLQAKVSAASIFIGETSIITVFVTDEKRYALEGIKVKFSMAAGVGEITPSEGVSDSSGKAQATFTTGKNAGTNAVKIESLGASPIYVNIESKIPFPAEFSAKIAPDKVYITQTAKVEVLVKDSRGKPFENVLVNFTVSDLIKVNRKSDKTNADGKVEITITAGKQSGSTKLEIKVGDLDSQSVDIEVLDPTIKDVVVTATPKKINLKGKSTVKVKVTDNFGSPVKDAKITFEVEEKDVTLSATQGVTDENGECVSILKPGKTEGTATVNVKANDSSHVKVDIEINNVVLPPSNVSATFSPSFVLPGDDTTVTAIVTDSEKTLLDGVTVYFDLISGGGKLLSYSAVSKSGKSSVVLTTGQKSGGNTVRIRVTDLNPIESSITTEGEIKYKRIETGAPTKIIECTNPKGLTIGDSCKISTMVVDDNYLPVPKVKVIFKIVKGTGNLSNEEITTDENGEGFVYLTSKERGSIDVTISSLNLPPVLVRVNCEYPIKYLLMIIILLPVVLFVIYIFNKCKAKKLTTSHLTGFYSDLYIKQKIKNCIRNKKEFSAIFIDLDDFKHFNIAYGYEKGDDVIKLVAKIIKNSVSSSDTIGHFGGDDFVVITSSKKARDISNKIIESYKENGKTKEHPLMSISLAIFSSIEFIPWNYNEFLNISGKLMKSAKAKKGNKISDTLDDDSEKGKKQYRIGWFTIGIILLVLLFINKATAGDVSENFILKGSANPGIVLIEGKSKITAYLTDNKDRPISNAPVLFTVEKGEGTFLKNWGITDKNGHCDATFVSGKGIRDNVVRIYFGKVKPVDIKIMGAVFDTTGFFIVVLSLGLSVLLLIKILKIGNLLIDPDVKFKTRPLAEKTLKDLIFSGTKFFVVFVEYKDFSKFDDEYGFKHGEEAVKVLAKQIRYVVKQYTGKEGTAFYYGVDRFVIVSMSGDPKCISENLIKEMKIHIPNLCEDKKIKFSITTNYYLLDLSIGIVTCNPPETKSLEEIMQKAGKLIKEVKSKPGSACLID
ncbi:MAG: Ig-like domain-containing protein [Candidatus Firestonebacteria bacterium]